MINPAKEKLLKKLLKQKEQELEEDHRLSHDIRCENNVCLIDRDLSIEYLMLEKEYLEYQLKWAYCDDETWNTIKKQLHNNEIYLAQFGNAVEDSHTK